MAYPDEFVQAMADAYALSEDLQLNLTNLLQQDGMQALIEDREVLTVDKLIYVSVDADQPLTRVLPLDFAQNLVALHEVIVNSEDTLDGDYDLGDLIVWFEKMVSCVTPLSTFSRFSAMRIASCYTTN